MEHSPDRARLDAKLLRHLRLHPPAGERLPPKYPFGGRVMELIVVTTQVTHLPAKPPFSAFDADLIGIDPDYRVHVSERLLAQCDGPMLKALK